METDQIIATLKRHQDDLHRQGVAHAALFGSRAHHQDGPESDIDILIELDPAARMNAYDYVGLKEYISGLFEGPVDVVNRDGLKPYLSSSILSNAVYAF